MRRSKAENRRVGEAELREGERALFSGEGGQSPDGIVGADQSVVGAVGGLGDGAQRRLGRQRLGFEGRDALLQIGEGRREIVERLA